MISITISGDNASEALADLRSLSAGLLGGTATTLPAAAPLAAHVVEPETPKADTAKPATGKAKAGAKAAAETSTAAKPESTETKAADKADEAKESKAAEPEKITVDTLRAAGGQYAALYGMPAALEDGPKIIGFPSFKVVPEDKLEVALNAMLAACEQNPFNRPDAPKAA
jgi:hypothetical protein